jgi:hypothetical protein
LEIHHDHIVIEHVRLLIIDIFEYQLGCEPKVLMHGVRKNTLEIEVHGVEELLLVHDEAELLQLNLFG